MALSMEFQDFIRRWIDKAARIELKDDLATYFDKFITTFIVYNRLYAEATFTLWRQGTIKPDLRRGFPDGAAAKEYVATFLGEPRMTYDLESNTDTALAIDMMGALIDGQDFNILLSGPESKPNRNRDMELRRKLSAACPIVRGRAVLEFVYAVRCNTLHGSKDFDAPQRRVLRPCIQVVERLITLLQTKLDA
jgi:hypothetical protein